MKQTDIKNFKHTKIVATLGPASSTPEIIEKLVESGVNIARLNFSHGTHEDHKQRIAIVRALSAKTHKPIAIIQDLQGPKIRLGMLMEKVIIPKKGNELILYHESNQVDERIPIQSDIFPYLKNGDSILINDGKVKLVVKEAKKDTAVCKVEYEGEIMSRKGVNLPDTQLPSMALTEKDKEDLAFGLKMEVDYVAISFVQDEKDIVYVRKIMDGNTHKPKIIAKIECGPAVRNVESIIKAADAVMVARGDMAVEVGQEEVPLIQRHIIKIARQEKKPVIVATQMLESMTYSPEPTRAEVNDVATAVIDQVDCVMLSAESAQGEYPVEAVSMMEKIIKRIERYEKEFHAFTERTNIFDKEKSTAIANAASLVADRLSAKAIFVLTNSGRSAQLISSYRQQNPIIAITDNFLTYNQLALVWGVKCYYLEKIKDNDQAFKNAAKHMKDRKIVVAGDTVVLVTGTHPGKTGFNDTIKVLTV